MAKYVFRIVVRLVLLNGHSEELVTNFNKCKWQSSLSVKFLRLKSLNVLYLECFLYRLRNAQNSYHVFQISLNKTSINNNKDIISKQAVGKKNLESLGQP